MFVNKYHVNKLKSNVLHKSVNRDCVIVYFFNEIFRCWVKAVLMVV
jgi:hypothetical protein